MLNLIVYLYFGYCLGYGCFSLLKKKENGLIKTVIITFLPGLGMLLAFYLFRLTSTPPVSEAETARFGDEENTDYSDAIQPLDLEKETNFVPLGDALLLNDNKTKRKLLIHSLKENSIQNPKLLNVALKDEDSETSHYAATSIMEMKRKLHNSIQDLSEKLNDNPTDLTLLTAYADAIKKYLKSELLDEGSYRQYQISFSSVLENIIDTGKGSIQQFIDKVDADLELHDYDKASFYSELFMEKYPLEEKAYITAMKLQYILQNRTALQEIISRLKRQPVHLSASSLDVIRYWN